MLEDVNKTADCHPDKTKKTNSLLAVPGLMSIVVLLWFNRKIKLIEIRALEGTNITLYIQEMWSRFIKDMIHGNWHFRSAGIDLPSSIDESVSTKSLE